MIVAVFGGATAIVALDIFHDAIYDSGITFHKQIFLVIEIGWSVAIMLLQFIGIGLVKGIVDDGYGVGAQQLFGGT